jgi:hypothetical protein
VGKPPITLQDCWCVHASTTAITPLFVHLCLRWFLSQPNAWVNILLVGSLQQSPIPPNAHRTEADVNIGKEDGKQAEPGPEHMAAIEGATAAINAGADRTAMQAIPPPADQVSQGMATKRVPR